MTDINNKLNLNNVHSTYTPSFKKEDDTKCAQNIKQDLEFFMKNPELAAAAVKSADNTYELLCADGVEYAYEKACCGACDAAYNRAGIVY